MKKFGGLLFWITVYIYDR